MLETSQLCRQLEADYGVARAIPAARGALGLMATLQAWVEKGGTPRVALCANVCQEVVAAVLGAHCTPVFLDIDPVDATVPEPEWLRARTEGASVALVVHLYGNPADVSAARRHFRAQDCLVIDDAAQALGATNAEGKAGAQGDVGLLSFGATKHIETGGAALLFQSVDFADAVARKLSAVPALSADYRAEQQTRFRRHLEAARVQLRARGDAAASEFNGLLDDYACVLQVPFPEAAAMATLTALNLYPAAKTLRLEKAAAWGESLSGSRFKPVGTQDGAVPWRYTCRLPGIDWAEQHRVGENLRALGLDVSHWYLPAHWMCGHAAGSLPGVEKLSRELFQFWVDASIPLDQIQRLGPFVSAAAENEVC